MNISKLTASAPTTARVIDWRAGRQLPLAVAVYAVLSALYTPASAAQTGERQLVDLEEVVVTARRREEMLQDIPLAVTALSADYLRAQNITRLEDLGIHVPSLGVSSGGPSTNTPVVVLRGQRPSEVLLTLDPAVPLYFAEVVLTPTQGTNLSLYDLSNVQVLKGPQGTLFGRNSTGGALLFTPQRPGDEFGGYVEMRLGNYDLVHVEGAVDLPASDTLKFRLAGISIDRDGYQSNVADNALRGSDKFWDEDSYGLRATMHFTPNDRLSNLTTVAYDENNMRARVPVPQAFNSSYQLGRLVNAVHNGGLGGLGGTPTTPAVDEALQRQRGRSAHRIETDVNTSDDVENWFVANTTEYEISEQLTIKNIFGYRELNSRNTSDADGTAVPLFGARTPTDAWVQRNPELGAVDSDQYSNELQLIGEAFDGRLDWIAGAYWMRMKGSQTFPIQVVGANPDWPAGAPPIPVPELNQLWYIAQNGFYQNSPNGDAENEAWAIFGEGDYEINDRWSVTLGLRQTWDDRALDAKNFGLDQNTLVFGCSMRDQDNNPLPDDACVRSVDKSFDKLTWRGSLNFNPMENMLLYGSIATGYRAGGFNARGTNNFTLQPFDEETVITYEIGHKTDWQLGNLASMRTNLAIYVQKYDDIQKTVSGVNPDTEAFETYTINAAEADINGVEFDVTIAPTHNLILALAFSWVDASYNEWDRLVETGEIVDWSNSPFVYIPEYSMTASVIYTLPLAPSIGDVSLSANVYWQDKMYSNDGAFRWPELGWSDEDLQEALDTVDIDSYTVAHFRIDWANVMGSSFDVAAFVNNAFDKEYIVGGLSVPDSLGWVAATYGAPRVYGASLRYRF